MFLYPLTTSAAPVPVPEDSWLQLLPQDCAVVTIPLTMMTMRMRIGVAVGGRQGEGGGGWTGRMKDRNRGRRRERERQGERRGNEYASKKGETARERKREAQRSHPMPNRTAYIVPVYPSPAPWTLYLLLLSRWVLSRSPWWSEFAFGCAAPLSLLPLCPFPGTSLPAGLSLCSRRRRRRRGRRRKGLE